MLFSVRIQTIWEINNYIDNIHKFNYKGIDLLRYSHNLIITKKIYKLTISRSENKHFTLSIFENGKYKVIFTTNTPKMSFDFDLNIEMPTNIKINDYIYHIDTDNTININSKVISKSDQIIINRVIPYNNDLNKLINNYNININNKIINKYYEQKIPFYINFNNKSAFLDIIKNAELDVEKFTRDEIAGVIESLINH